MINRHRFDNDLTDGFGVLQIRGKSAKNQEQLFIPLKQTHYQAEIIGPLIYGEITQTFFFAQGNRRRPVEAWYRFPLPGDAAVLQATARFGEVTIETRLDRRDHAEEAFEKAKQSHKQATLLTREAPDVFTLKIAGIQPGEEVVIVISFIQLADQKGNRWRLRLPLTTAPRFTRHDEKGTAVHAGPLALMRDPRHRFACAIDLQGAVNVTSPTHAIKTVEWAGEPGEPSGCEVTLADGYLCPMLFRKGGKSIYRLRVYPCSSHQSAVPTAIPRRSCSRCVKHHILMI
ncbi:VIT domain-containing protein [Heliophilum fasciatum]|uniref:Vault protein inter-alpha-trypsin-like protein n=1 Tax=Heliophilum fasciatum TaxID=35700 RepID=A0A4R2RCU3_9FIRM|nr:VIT domain-containing protein [Heliophilum fasciatum]MCW2279137.1 hypothetical protein [Heliophilum fasciatum]TCP61222.1 vault protein inter-alpha-trypsin-like protein [Heliophilum fasciatum]